MIFNKFSCVSLYLKGYNNFRPTFEEGEDSGHIEFLSFKEEQAQSGHQQESVDGSASVPPASRVKKLKFLYIQMQLCEKSTLR